MSLKDASQCQAPGHALSGHVRASIDAAARPRRYDMASLDLSRCLAPDHGPSGQSAWPLRTRPVPGTGRVSKGRGRARALAEELDDRVEAAVEDVLLDHERRCEDQ